MIQSDLSKLKTFLQTLPEHKKMEVWDERYIDDIKSMGGYEQAKELSKKRSRYVNSDKISDSGYSTKDFENLCDRNSTKEQCHSCCNYNNNECVYDPVLCNDWFAKNVKNWEDINSYHISFLKGETPGTPNHPGPWNIETEYILGPLIKILNNNILTMDSQPGLMVDDDYIQKPYIQIGGSAERIHKILIDLLCSGEKGENTFDNTIIKYVPYGARKLNFTGYKNYQHDGKDYVSVYLGIETPKYLINEYTDYVFSNRFFNRIANVIGIN